MYHFTRPCSPVEQSRLTLPKGVAEITRVLQQSVDGNGDLTMNCKYALDRERPSDVASNCSFCAAQTLAKCLS